MTASLRWVYFEMAGVDAPLVYSTNQSEGINSKLNSGVKLCETVQEQIYEVRKFKINEIERYYEIFHAQHWHPGRRLATRERHEKLYQLVNNFANLGVVAQCDELLTYALEIGQLMMHTRAKK